MIRSSKETIKNNTIGTSYVILAAALWGSSFAVRKIGMQSIGPLMMNTSRFFLAFLFLLLIAVIKTFVKSEKISAPKLKSQIKLGIIIGIPYAFNVVFQQIGLNTVSAGETGFITSLYTVMVPILGWIIFKYKLRPVNIMAVFLSVVGLYLVTNGGMSFNFGMVLLFIGAICAAIQILMIGLYIDDNDPLILVTVQVGIGTIINLVMAIILREPFEIQMLYDSIWPIVYSGILSVGVANFCQFLGQKRVSPATTAIACSSESVFGLLFGILLLGETMTFMKACGCIVILATVIMIQYVPGKLPDK